jgi:hypothetical protein
MSGSREALLAIACCLLVPHTTSGEQVVRTIEWQKLAEANALTSGTIVAPPTAEQRPSLRIVHTASAPATFLLVTIDRPGITTARYAIRGRVKYDGVASASYLEMWNYLPEGAFFSRSLDQSGPMGRLEGTSGWRAFVLPFMNQEGGPPPQKLVLNLVMTGTGTVEIEPLELVQFAPGEDPFADSTAWWSDRQAGMLGAVVGSAMGILGALVGWLGSAARAKGFVLGTLKALRLLGIAALLCSVVALGMGQPYAVFYPLALLGTISVALGFSLPRSLSKRYEELELRRMQALDA